MSAQFTVELQVPQGVLLARQHYTTARHALLAVRHFAKQCDRRNQGFVVAHRGGVELTYDALRRMAGQA